MTKTPLQPIPQYTALETSPDKQPVSCPLPGPGEIALTGKVTTLIRQERQLMLGATRLTLAEDNASIFSPARPMLIVLPESTAIYLGQTAKRLPWMELNTGHTIYLIGIDQGTGQPVAAKQVWVLLSEVRSMNDEKGTAH